MAMRSARATFDIVASALVFHFILDRAKAFAEMNGCCARAGSSRLHLEAARPTPTSRLMRR